MKHTFTLNDQPCEVEAPSDTPLLWVLRDHLELSGTKFGCGRALCGACTVHIDGEAVRSCAYPIRFVSGKNVRTIEGLQGDAEGRAVIDAWLEEEVVQCGWCQPGQCMSAAALLKEVKDPDASSIDAAMSGNLCRCGTYPRIRKAIQTAARTLREGGNR